MNVFKGACTALSTPFTDSGINFDSFEKLIEFQIENDIDALLVCGTTGEPSTMTKEEKQSVIDFAVKQADKRVPIIAGTGGNNTAAVMDASKAAADSGADALLIVTPYYNKCTPAGLIRHYIMIADAVDIPIIVYNVPGRTGLNITPDVLSNISAHKNIAGIKEASGDIKQITEMARRCLNDIAIYSGNDDHVVPVLSVGGTGVVSVASNIAPREVHDMVMHYLNGEPDKALALQFRLNPLNQALFSEVNPIPVKTAMNMLKFNMGPLRMPLCDMTETNRQRLLDALVQFGFTIDEK